MSPFARCVFRNIAIGIACALLIGAMYRHILVDMHTTFAYILLAAVCTLGFSAGAVSYTRDSDDKDFKDYVQYGRGTVLFMAPCAFIGLLLFEWWGLGAGFFAGSFMSYTFLSTIGIEKSSEPIIPRDGPPPSPSRIRKRQESPTLGAQLDRSDPLVAAPGAAQPRASAGARHG